MAIFFRTLTILYLLLSIASFALGSMLFARRELLKGRTQVLEKTLIEVAGFIEVEDAPEIENDFTSRDVSDVSAQELTQDELEFSDFWRSYDFELEGQERPVSDLGSKRDVLMAYYKRDFTGKIEKDLTTGYRITQGKGTMHDLLEEFKARVVKQHTRLNLTRQQLTTLREEMVATVEDLNERKKTLRSKLAEIVVLNGTISTLNSRIADLESQISSLQLQIRGLQDEVSIRDEKIRKLEEDVKVKETDIANLKQEIKDLRATANVLGAGGSGRGAGPIGDRYVAPGSKGSVVSVNTKWAYIVFSVSQEFINELDAINETLSRNLDSGEMPSVPSIELLVKRGDDRSTATFVSKLRLRQLDRANMLAVGDIMTNWQQHDIRVGDGVFY